MTVPRQPDPQSKIVQLIAKAHPGEEKKVRAFKEICARNNIAYRDVVMEKVDQFLKEHHWPPGNSQTLLETFGAKAEFACSRCGGLFPKLQKVQFVSGLKGQLCDKCCEHERERDVIKKGLGVLQ